MESLDSNYQLVSVLLRHTRYHKSDKATGVSTKEQLAICFCYVDYRCNWQVIADHLLSHLKHAPASHMTDWAHKYDGGGGKRKELLPVLLQFYCLTEKRNTV